MSEDDTESEALPSSPDLSDAPHGTNSQWSEAIRQFMQSGTYDPDAFEIDRSDLAPVL